MHEDPSSQSLESDEEDDEEEEILGTDDDEQEDPRDYCKGRHFTKHAFFYCCFSCVNCNTHFFLHL